MTTNIRRMMKLEANLVKDVEKKITVTIEDELRSLILIPLERVKRGSFRALD
jgi:hypothetical protein